jgi:hypothetical protein
MRHLRGAARHAPSNAGVAALTSPALRRLRWMARPAPLACSAKAPARSPAGGQVAADERDCYR